MTRNIMTAQDLNMFRQQYRHLREMADMLEQHGRETGHDILERHALDALDALAENRPNMVKVAVYTMRWKMIEAGERAAIHQFAPTWHDMVKVAQQWDVDTQVTRNMERSRKQQERSFDH